jgi:hypothetical protein
MAALRSPTWAIADFRWPSVRAPGLRRFTTTTNWAIRQRTAARCIWYQAIDAEPGRTAFLKLPAVSGVIPTRWKHWFLFR